MIGTGNVYAAVGTDIVGQLQLMHGPLKRGSALFRIPVKQIVPYADLADHQICRLCGIDISVNHGLLCLVVDREVDSAVAHFFCCQRPFLRGVPFFENQTAKTHSMPPCDCIK